MYRRIGMMATRPTESTSLKLGRKVEQLMKAKGWSYVELADASGVAKSTLLELVKGRSSPCLPTIEAVAGAFDMSISELFKGV